MISRGTSCRDWFRFVVVVGRGFSCCEASGRRGETRLRTCWSRCGQADRGPIVEYVPTPGDGGACLRLFPCVKVDWEASQDRPGCCKGVPGGSVRYTHCGTGGLGSPATAHLHCTVWYLQLHHLHMHMHLHLRLQTVEGRDCTPGSPHTTCTPSPASARITAHAGTVYSTLVS